MGAYGEPGSRLPCAIILSLALLCTTYAGPMENVQRLSFLGGGNIKFYRHLRAHGGGAARVAKLQCRQAAAALSVQPTSPSKPASHQPSGYCAAAATQPPCNRFYFIFHAAQNTL